MNQRRNFIRNIRLGAATTLISGLDNAAFAHDSLIASSSLSVNPDIKRLFPVFKNHWDFGFTTSAQKLTLNIMQWHFSTNIQLAKTLKEKGLSPPPVLYGSWIIAEGLEFLKGNRLKALETAIADNIISYSAMPFSTQSEFYDRHVIEYGISIASMLDSKFGRKTTFAKVSDVPCHTINLVPILCSFGIEFLHIGANWISKTPKYPISLFGKRQAVMPT